MPVTHHALSKKWAHTVHDCQEKLQSGVCVTPRARASGEHYGHQRRRLLCVPTCRCAVWCGANGVDSAPTSAHPGRIREQRISCLSTTRVVTGARGSVTAVSAAALATDVGARWLVERINLRQAKTSSDQNPPLVTSRWRSVSSVRTRAVPLQTRDEALPRAHSPVTMRMAAVTVGSEAVDLVEKAALIQTERLAC